MSRWRDDPSGVRPMLASLDTPPETGAGLVYEPKYDGIRALAAVEVDGTGAVTVKLYSRNGREKQDQFPAVAAALAQLGRKAARPLIIDGELVAIDGHGRPLGFQHIQGRIHLRGAQDIAAAETAQPAVFIGFDLLRDGPEDLRGEAFALRRLRLQKLMPKSRARTPLLRISEIAIDDGREMLARARSEGWEGLIVKDGTAPYHSGRRTPAWRKLKLLAEQEFVVGGWTEPRQTRQHFGSLLLGYYDGKRLVWCGHVGTGFTQTTIDEIAAQLRARERRTSPFANPVKTVETPHWVRPDLVAQVRFIEWTSDGLLRQPVFLGLRDDKAAADVHREGGATGPPAPAVKAPKIYRTRRATLHTPTAGPVSHDALVDELQQLEANRRDGDLVLPGGVLHVTNLAKKFWPDLGITKGELLRYYVDVAPMILPVVEDRPLVMRRFPNGVGGSAFYQQKHPEAPPAGVRRETLAPDVDPPDENGPRERLIGGSLITLLYQVQLAAISQDPWFSRADDPWHQDFAAIDLDPGDEVEFEQVLDVARHVKEELDAHGIPAWPKTSGASGLHIYIRLPPETTYDTGQVLCRIIASTVATKYPRIATVERMVKRRPRKTVYVDFLQNILGKTLACAYSARASDYAGVSTPLTWDEVARGVDPRDFTIRTAPARFAAVGDLWAAFRKSRPVNLRAVARARAQG
jgi:bifunctional non-homologous end joining protein LigD